MKVHITLVGGQPAPVYNGIIATQPDKVVFIYSESSIRAVEMVKSVMPPSIEVGDVAPLHPTDPKLILECAKQLAEKYKEDDVTLNISSGLKSWSHLFGRVFDGLSNASVVYMDQNNVLWNFKTFKSSDDFVFDMDTLFRLYGNNLIHYSEFVNYTEEDYNSSLIIEKARKYNFIQFNNLTTVLTKEWDSNLANQERGKFTYSKDEDVFVEWAKDDYVRLILKTKKWGSHEYLINSPHATKLVFHSGWFEYKIARMLSHWQYSKEIRMNCIFPVTTTPHNDRFPKNEVDIIVNTGRKILFVECKTHINSSNDIDKFHTVVKNYGGVGSKAIFVTDNPMPPIAKEKCAESGIITFSLQESGTNKEQELFRLLNSELFSINSR